jgi:hypothetical protein
MDDSADDQLWTDTMSMNEFNSTPLSFPPITGDVGQGVLLHGAVERPEGILDPTRSDIVLERNASITNPSYHEETECQPSMFIDPSFNSAETSLTNISANLFDGNLTFADGYTIDEVDDRSFYVSGPVKFQGPWDEHQV